MNARKTLSALLIVGGGLSAAVLGSAPVRASCVAGGYGAISSGSFGRIAAVQETPEERAARIAAAAERRAARQLAKAEKKAAREAAKLSVSETTVLTPGGG